MTIKVFRHLLLLSLLLTSLGAQAQEDVYYVDTYAGEASVCAWASIILHEVPGRNTNKIGEVVFAEEVEHLGKEALVRSERRNYVWVKTKDGKMGWVNETYIVRNGGVVVLLEDATIYRKPGTLSSATTDQFPQGSILILSDFKDNWVFLTGPRKELSGWVEGYEKLSVAPGDIEAATMLARAQTVEDPTQRRGELTKLLQTRSNISPEMEAVVRSQINTTYPQPQPQPGPGPARDMGEVLFDAPTLTGGEDALMDETYRPGPAYTGATIPVANTLPAYNRIEREVIDMETGRSYIRVYETGTIQPVKAKNPPDIFYCYHKSLPIGTTVLLDVPGYEGKYIPLKVIARLRPDNPNLIGLGGEVIERVFGEKAAKDVSGATISYPMMN